VDKFKSIDLDTLVISYSVFDLEGVTSSSNVNFNVSGVLLVMPGVSFTNGSGDVDDELLSVSV
jgi:hypothetical protein